MDEKTREMMDRVYERFENFLLWYSSTMLTIAIVSTVVLPIFTHLQKYFLYSANIHMATLGCFTVCAFLSFILCTWLYPIVADNKFLYFNQYPMWIKILDVVICFSFLVVVNHTFILSGMAVLLSYATALFAGFNSDYITDRMESIKKDIADQEELKRKELLKNTRALTRMDVYDILYMP
jgi:hypothetical protein